MLARTLVTGAILMGGFSAAANAAGEATLHAALPVAGGFEARNPGEAWRTRFDGRGFLVEPDAGGWTWGLALERYGFTGRERKVATPECSSAEGARVTYGWCGDLEEWYVNDSRGLEHGYTLFRRPPCHAGDEPCDAGPLTLTLAVLGDLQPKVTADGRGVLFSDGGGSVAVQYLGLTVFDARGRELDASFETRRDRLLLAVDESDACYPLTIDPIAQQAYLKGFNTTAFDFFGTSVAASGNTIVVGAPGECSNATGVNGVPTPGPSACDSGAAYVFVRKGRTWSQEAYLKASNTGVGDQFGTSVAISGDTVVVGARRERSSATGVNGDQSDNSAQYSGAAYVFERNGTTWSQQAYLKASNAEAFDEFGASVAVAGNTVVIGAPEEDSLATGVNGDESDNQAARAGAVYVFSRSGTSWTQEAYVKPFNADFDDRFGAAVAIGGDTLVVGAHQEDSGSAGLNGNPDDDSALDSGAAYVFSRSGSIWSQEAYFKAGNADAGDGFGGSVALAGGRVAVGAPGEQSDATGVDGDPSSDAAPGAGAVYVFVRDGASWNQEAYLKASNTDAGDGFGGSLALLDDTLVVGAPGERSGSTGVNGIEADNSFPNAGAAYVFGLTGKTWNQAAYLKASNTDAGDQFGSSVAIAESTVVVGAIEERSNATGLNGDESNNAALAAGAAYLFDRGAVEGARFCSLSPNSAGEGAAIGACGSASVAANDLTLVATGVPSLEHGIFFYGPEALLGSPFGDGLRCVGGPDGTVVQAFPVVRADEAGRMSNEIDNSLPVHAQIVPGATLHFQVWFRDPDAGMSGFNLSDGLSISFAP